VRAPWFEVSCCPPNICRFLPSVPGYVYAVKEDTLFVNLFIGGRADVEIDGVTASLKQETRYPWDGAVKIAVDPERQKIFTLAVRIPGWARNEPVPSDLYRFADTSAAVPSLKVNGRAADIELKKGYALIRRAWSKGDTVELDLPMPVRRVIAHPSVQADAGRMALQRGPLVYCAEGIDNGGTAISLVIPEKAAFAPEFRAALLKGVVVLKGKAAGRDVTLIPYYAWANRGPGEMQVWFKQK
jgi:hypothetical protein